MTTPKVLTAMVLLALSGLATACGGEDEDDQDVVDVMVDQAGQAGAAHPTYEPIVFRKRIDKTGP